MLTVDLCRTNVCCINYDMQESAFIEVAFAWVAALGLVYVFSRNILFSLPFNKATVAWLYKKYV